MKDALGNPLVVGRTYGYSRSENGLTTVKVGKLVKINERMVTLEVVESKKATYSNDLSNYKPGRAISVKANGLFPVDDYWERRCKAAEAYIEETPCDPDIHDEQWLAYCSWQGIINERL